MVMNENNQLDDSSMELSIGGPNFFKIGFWLTLTYISAVVGFSIWDFSDVIAMKPNEWGDFLAGIFGPLALLWVVLGFLQQGSELRNSRDALLLQAKELRHSVDAQNNMADAAWTQVSIEKEYQAKLQNDERLANLPSFNLIIVNKWEKEEDKHFVLRIENAGDLATSVKFEYSELKPTRVAMFDENKSHDPKRFYPKDKCNINFVLGDYIEMVGNPILLKYRDKTGNPHSKKFEFIDLDGEVAIASHLGQSLTDD